MCQLTEALAEETFEIISAKYPFQFLTFLCYSQQIHVVKYTWKFYIFTKNKTKENLYKLSSLSLTRQMQKVL